MYRNEYKLVFQVPNIPARLRNKLQKLVNIHPTYLESEKYFSDLELDGEIIITADTLNAWIGQGKISRLGNVGTKTMADTLHALARYAANSQN